jgi:hypothetical protein
LNLTELVISIFAIIGCIIGIGTSFIFAVYLLDEIWTWLNNGIWASIKNNAEESKRFIGYFFHKLYKKESDDWVEYDSYHHCIKCNDFVGRKKKNNEFICKKCGG